MQTIYAFSYKGGTGRTTVACNLGAELHRRGARALVVDADPQNAVGLHLGMQVGERFGLARADATRQAAESYARRGAELVPHLPFGHSEQEELVAFGLARREDGDWLPDQIARLAPADTEYAIVDTPVGVTDWTRRPLAQADAVVIVLHPDAASYATLPAIGALVAAGGLGGRLGVLVNGMDSRQPLAGEVWTALSNSAGEHLLPFTVPLDEALREAFAAQIPVARHAPDSQTVRAFAQLADWVQGAPLNEREDSDEPLRVGTPG